MPVPGIAEVKATGPRTVEFRLKAPIATFLGFGGAGAVPIVPKHIWESIDHAAMATDPKVLVARVPIGSSPTPAATAPTSTPPTTTTSSGSPS